MPTSSGELRAQILEHFPALRSLPVKTLEEILTRGQLREAARGTVMFEANSPCRGFPMVLSGIIKVVKRDAQGREIELYRVHAGESCVISGSCLLGKSDYNASGIAVTDVRLWYLPPAVFNELIAREEPFRDYVFGLFSARLADVMELIEAVAFQKLDQRLASLLLENANVLQGTQQQLADRLGTAREIVGRLLNHFESRGIVAISRGQIRVLDPAGLREIAQRDQ